jgi:hypothetical protein
LFWEPLADLSAQPAALFRKRTFECHELDTYKKYTTHWLPQFEQSFILSAPAIFARQFWQSIRYCWHVFIWHVFIQLSELLIIFFPLLDLCP